MEGTMQKKTVFWYAIAIARLFERRCRYAAAVAAVPQQPYAVPR